MTYQEKLKDPRWQKKRLEILQRDNFTCENCGDSETELHVHHRWYEKNTEIWDYPNEVFETLCVNCHNHYSAADKKNFIIEINETLKKLSTVELQNIAINFFINYRNPIINYRKRENNG